VSQAGANGRVDLEVVQLAFERTISPPLFRLPLRLRGEILSARAVAPQFATDRGRLTAQSRGNFCLSCALQQLLNYQITLFHRKMTCHRWDSVPKGEVCKTSPIRTSQRWFHRYRLAPFHEGV